MQHISMVVPKGDFFIDLDRRFLMPIPKNGNQTLVSIFSFFEISIISKFYNIIQISCILQDLRNFQIIMYLTFSFFLSKKNCYIFVYTSN